jgi:hypothetical protein
LDQFDIGFPASDSFTSYPIGEEPVSDIDEGVAVAVVVKVKPEAAGVAETMCERGTVRHGGRSAMIVPRGQSWITGQRQQS